MARSRKLEQFNYPGLAMAYITHGKNNLGSRPCYTNWFNGCAIGTTATLPAARREMFKFLMREAYDRMEKALERAATLKQSRAAILKRFDKNAADRGT